MASWITSQSRASGRVALAISQARKRPKLTRAFTRVRAEGIEVVDMGRCVARFGPSWNQLGVKKGPENQQYGCRTGM
jgi:hypothetical protein